MCNEVEKLDLHDPSCVTSILQLLEKHIFHLQESLHNERRRRLALEARCKQMEHLHKTYQLQTKDKCGTSTLTTNDYGRHKLDLYSGYSDDDTKAEVVVPAFEETASLNTALVGNTSSSNEEGMVAIKEQLGAHEMSMKNSKQPSVQQSADKINDKLPNADGSYRLLKERNYNSTSSVVGDYVKLVSPLAVNVEAMNPKRLCKKRMSLLKRTKKSDDKKILHDKRIEAKQISLTEMVTRLTKKDALNSDQGVTYDDEIQCGPSTRPNSRTRFPENPTDVAQPSKRPAHSQDIFRILDTSSDEEDVNVLLRSPPAADGSLRAILATPASPVANDCPSVAVITQKSPDIIYVADTNEECLATAPAKSSTGPHHMQLKKYCASMSKPIDHDTQGSYNLSYSRKSVKNEWNPVILTRPVSKDRESPAITSKFNLKQQYNIDCKDCQGFIDLMGNTVTTAEVEKLLRNCKRHKASNMLRQESPVGFWNPLLLSFAEDDCRNEVLIDNRFIQTKN